MALGSRFPGCAVLLAMLMAGAVQTASARAPVAPANAVRCPWVASTAPVAQRVEQLLARMTLAQKLHMLHGVRGGAYTGEVPAIPALCIPALTLQDGPGGVGDGMTGVTQLPAPVALAATWNVDLARQYGAVIGAEARAKGIEVNLGPTLNLVRDPRWGRAFETYGEDPWLTGQIGTAYVEGVQGQGVMADIKHVAVYNQETNRNTPEDDVLVDRRTLQELYLPQFEQVIRNAHPATAMCAYSTINGVNACADAYTLTRVLRDQFGFRGFVVSDWGGTHATLGPAKAGMNMEMPDGRYYGAALEAAVKSGAVPIATIDALVRPILAGMFRFKLFTRARVGKPDAIATTPAHVGVARAVAEQAAVLLKNAERALPLSATALHSIAVIGSDAGVHAVSVGGGSAHVESSQVVTPFEGIRARAGSAVQVRYAQGDLLEREPPVIPAKYLAPTHGKGHGLTAQLYANSDLAGPAVATVNVPELNIRLSGSPPAAGMPADHWSAHLTATLTPPVTGTYTFALTSDDGSRLSVAGKRIIDNWGDHAANTKSGSVQLRAGKPVAIAIDYYQAAGKALLRLGWRVPGVIAPKRQALLQQAVQLAKRSNVAIVFAGSLETEGSDLANISLPGNQDHLIAAVAAVNPDTIVVLNTGSAVAMPWLGKVKAVIEAWYPGQEDGPAIAALLFGDQNPSGKLPVTFPRALADVPAATPAQWPGVDGRVHYSEGLQVGYRWYDAKRIQPLFAFGHGLSYTTFAFSALKVTPQVIAPTGSVHVTVAVTNSGQRRGAEVVQLYVGDPAATGEPPKQLKGFRRVVLEPGETRDVSFDVPARALATWDVRTQGWRVATGTYTIMLGDASDDLPQRALIRVSHRAEP